MEYKNETEGMDGNWRTKLAKITLVVSSVCPFAQHSIQQPASQPAREIAQRFQLGICTNQERFKKVRGKKKKFEETPGFYDMLQETRVPSSQLTNKMPDFMNFAMN